MPHLRITCFHTFQATLDGHPVTDFRSAKGRALLVYLAVEQEQAQQRSRLAGLLWPDEAEDRARRNLSQTLLEVRRALRPFHKLRVQGPVSSSVGEPVEPTDEVGFLEATSQTLRLNPASDHWVDVAAFCALLAAVSKHNHAQLVSCAACTRQLAQALALYRGAFLADFVVPASDLFENWLVTRREQLHQQAVDAFTSLSRCYQAQGDLAQAQQTVRRLLELAPWQEEAHRQLMLLLALSGQRTQALAQYDRCAQLLMDELGVPPSQATDALYDRILAGEIRAQEDSASIAVTPPAPASLPPPFQVLTPPPHFVGRDHELVHLQTGLTQPGTPIYALVGMGGVGKTTLASYVAHQVRAHFADGVLWANAASSEPLDILASWARAYGYDFSGLTDVASRAAAVRGILADKAVLLVLDNVLEASKVQPLLPSGACNPVLLTTRDLDVASALNAQPLLLGELSVENSRQLLARILGEERVQAEEAAAAQIGALLHYLPLAVEIVAQRLKSRPRQPLTQMAERLQHEEDRLGLEISDRAVRASFAVSWQTLATKLQRTFTLLAVFAGRPFTAAAIAHIADEKVGVIEERLYSLEALSLVKAEGETYYRQHPLLADFASEKLLDANAACGRMAAYYYNFAQANKTNYALLEPEWANIMAAIQVTHRQANWSLLLAFTDALTQTWLTRARYGEARQVYALAQEATSQLGDESRQAANLLRWGEVCIEQNDYDEASQLLTKSLALYYQIEDGAGIANAQFELAHIAIERSQYDEAEQLLQGCFSIRTILSDVEGVASVRYRQAWISFARNNLDTTNKLLQDALHTFEVTQNKRWLMPTLRFLAQVAAKHEAYTLAHGYCERTYQLAQELEDEGELATLHYTWTVVFRRQGNFYEAKAQAQQALPLLQRLGLRRLEGMVHYQLGAVLKELQEFDQTQIHLLESIKIFDSVQDMLGKLFSLILLGDLYQVLEHVEKSKCVWLEAQAVAQQLDDHDVLQELQQKLDTLS